MKRRVAITGMSVACGLGLELEELWEGLTSGRSGVREIDFGPAGQTLPVRVAGLLPPGALEAGCARYGVRDRDRPTQLALFAVGRALEHAGLPCRGEEPLEAGVIVGTGHGTLTTDHEAMHAYVEGGYRKIRPTTVLRLMLNRAASQASIHFKLTGGAHVVSAACASASVALGEAFHLVRHGVAEVMVAAGADYGLDLETFSAWCRLGVLSRNPDPARASRPFDAARDGMVLGEGAAAFVLESFEGAERRGAPILAEIAGYGGSADAAHIARPERRGQLAAIHRALADAGISAAEVDYVNAHGTATELADVVEAASLREALGGRADEVPVSTTKGHLGHLIAATAGVELAATVLALRHQTVPPCRNLDEVDPRCRLAFVREAPLRAPLRHALKSSFAFGGTNSVLVVRAAPE